MYRTVLVDDDPAFRDWLRPLLERSEHFEVCGEAGNGAECIAFLNHETPDVVVLDVYMPGCDGLELAQHIREHYPGIMTIVTSSHSERVYSRLARQEGAAAFIPKADLSVAALLEALQGVSAQ